MESVLQPFAPANIRSKIYEAAIKTRPEKFKNTGYNVNEQTQQFLASIHQSGMDPRELAEWLKRGIENEQFLVVPYKSAERMIELALQRFVDYASPEGIKRWEEKQKQPPTEEELQLMAEEKVISPIPASLPCRKWIPVSPRPEKISIG